VEVPVGVQVVSSTDCSMARSFGRRKSAGASFLAPDRARCGRTDKDGIIMGSAGERKMMGATGQDPGRDLTMR